MKDRDLRFIVKSIDQYLQMMSYSGCDDFDLEAFIPDLEERKGFVKAYHDWNGDPDEFDPEYLELGESAVLAFLTHQFKESYGLSDP